MIAQATGDAARFDAVQAEYAKAPAVTRERMYLDTMQQIYSRSSKVLVDGRGNNNLIYLPLDKLISSQGANGSNGNGGGNDSASNSAAKLPFTSGAIEDLNADQPSSGLASRNGGSASSGGQGSDDDPLRSRSVFRSRDRSESLQDVPGAPGGQ